MTPITYETVLQWADHEAGPLCMDKDYQAARRLLEAAPDLLEALQYVVKRIEDSWEWWMVVEERGGFDVKKLEAAIAKATGNKI